MRGATRKRPLGYASGGATGERVLPHQLARRVHLVTHRARYDYAAGLASSATVLDAGCGTGYGAHALAAAGHDVLAIDVSPEAIDYARAFYAHPRLRFEVMDGQRPALEGARFDMATSFEVIEHLEQPLEYLQGIHRALRADGVLVISTPNRERSAWANGKPVNPTHVTEYFAEEFRELLTDQGFEPVQWLGQASGARTRRLARAAAAIAGRTARMSAARDPGAWPSWWERALVVASAPVAARTTWGAVARENAVRGLAPEASDFFVVVARRVERA